MKVSLYVPPGGYFAERWSQGHMMPALGILYMAAVLEKNGVDVEVVPSHVLKLSWKDIYRRIETDKPDVVGITTTTENRFLGFKLAEVAKRAYPETFVVMGGPHFNGTAHDTLLHLPAVDGVVSGEGEITLLELVKALEQKGDLKDIQGLSFRKDGHIIHNPQRVLVPDLNDLPLPARHLEPWKAYNFTMDIPGKGPVPAGNMMTSRGCPFTCTFCATPTNWGRKVRGLTPENVVKEVEHLMEHYEAQAIWFYDDTFNYNPKRLEKICDLMIERKLNVKWYCEIRVDVMSKRLLAKMAEAGLYYVGFGIESASERVSRDIVTKQATLQEAYDVIRWSLEFGITPNPFFIFSHPTETWEEAQETIRVIEETRAMGCDVSASITHIYPGTPLEQRAKAEGKLPRDFSWTKKNDRRVILLTAAQGHAPLYIDKLTWSQICELIFRFSNIHRKISLYRKIPIVLKSIRSWGDVYRYSVMAFVFAKLKLRKFFERNRQQPPPHFKMKSAMPNSQG